MNVLSVERVAKRYGPRQLFSDISFGLEKGQKTAIVARNGTGKSTLLKCIAGLETPDEGKVSFNKGLRIGYLAGAPEVVDMIRRTCLVYSVNGIAQEAALAALRDDADHIRRGRNLVRSSRAYLREELGKMDLPVITGEGNWKIVAPVRKQGN